MASTKTAGKKKDAPLSLKGMRDIMGEEYFAYLGFAEKAAEVALYYGFSPIITPIMEREEVFTSGLGASSDVVGKEMYSLKVKGGDAIALRPEGTAGIMRAYLEHGMQAMPQPVMLYYEGPFFRHDNPQKGRLRELRQFGIEIIGSSKSIMDAIIIRVVVAILAEAGLKNTLVQVNSLGCKDCRDSYRKELSSYYRKHAKDICADCRERLKTNPLRVLDCKNEKCQPIKDGSPESIAFLCADCKRHFKEVMEYLDETGINYQLKHNLVRGLDYYSRTVFEVLDLDSINEEEGALPLAIAAGGRYDYLSKHLGSKKDLPAVGGAIGIDRVLMQKHHTKLAPRIMKKPEIFFIQLGFDAKVRSLQVVDILRKARIPIQHSLGKDSLSVQLAIAEKLEIPYCLILGQKEVIDGTVIVRTMANRSQDTVKIEKLAEYLKKLKK